MMSNNFNWPVRIYIEDTDVGGVVYHASYLKFMERARTEYLRHLGFGKTFIFNAQLLFVVHSLSIRYIKPVKLDDVLQVATRVVNVGKTSVVWKQQMLRDNQLVCDADVVIACVDPRLMKPRRIPDDMLQGLSYHA